MKLERKGVQNPRRLVVIAGMLLILFTFCLSFIPRSPISAATPTPTQKGKKCKFYYKVMPGDTIIGIGQLFQYDWRSIAEANKLKEPYVLTPGDKLCIPGGVAPTIIQGTEGAATITAKVQPTGSVVGGFGNVYLKLEHFPKNKIYNVLLRPNTMYSLPNLPPNPPKTNVYQSYRLNCMAINYPGVLSVKDHTQCSPIRTDNKGFFEGYFRIPTYIPNVSTYQLCIKDVWTDETLCTDFNNPEYGYVKYAVASHKYGR